MTIEAKIQEAQTAAIEFVNENGLDYKNDNGAQFWDLIERANAATDSKTQAWLTVCAINEANADVDKKILRAIRKEANRA